MKFKIGDEVTTLTGKGIIFKLPEDSNPFYTVKMTVFNGKDYPAFLQGIHESNLKLVEKTEIFCT